MRSAVFLLIVFAGLAGGACKKSETPVGPAPAPVPAPASGADFAAGALADPNVPPADAEKTPSGLLFKVLTPGTGSEHPGPGDYVEVHYRGYRKDGTLFEGTGPDEARRLDRAELIPGLDEGLGLMVVGEKRRFWIPYALAYKTKPHHINAPQEDMTYEVELLRIIKRPTPPEALTPPKGARRTKSGLAYQVLKKGTGTVHLSKDGRAEIAQTTWDAKGRMANTSLLTADAVPVFLPKLVPGWREALMLMVEGEKTRFWIPGKIAFGEVPPGEEALPFGPPLGPVIMDIELIRIVHDAGAPR